MTPAGGRRKRSTHRRKRSTRVSPRPLPPRTHPFPFPFICQRSKAICVGCLSVGTRPQFSPSAAIRSFRPTPNNRTPLTPHTRVPPPPHPHPPPPTPTPTCAAATAGSPSTPLLPQNCQFSVAAALSPHRLLRCTIVFLFLCDFCHQTYSISQRVTPSSFPSLPPSLPPVLYCTVLYCTVLYCTVLYCTVLCYTCLFFEKETQGPARLRPGKKRGGGSRY